MPRIQPSLLLSPLLACALLLGACDNARIAKLEEGVATEADVRKQFGDPVMIVEKADGSKVMEYPRQPEGTTNYLITIGADGKMSALRQLLTPANFAKVQPGMAQDEVRKLLGKPAKQQAFALKPGQEVWDWRFIDASTGDAKKLFSVTFDADRRVVGSATSDDRGENQRGY